MIVKLKNSRGDVLHEFVPHDTHFARPSFARRIILEHQGRYFVYMLTEQGGNSMVFEEAQLYTVNVAIGGGDGVGTQD